MYGDGCVIVVPKEIVSQDKFIKDCHRSVCCEVYWPRRSPTERSSSHGSAGEFWNLKIISG